MIEPEAAPPAPQTRRHRRIVVAGVTLLAVVAGGFAVATGGDRPEGKPLALMATNGQGDAAGAELQAPTAASGFASSDSRSAMPYPYWGGLTFKVEGNLPELADHAPAWKASGPALDRAAVTRIAGALGVSGTPVQRDGGWEVDGGDWTLNAFPGGDMWSVNLFRGRYDGRGDDAAAPATTTGPALSRAQAEARVRDLIERMDAPGGSWKVDITETDIGVGWGCAAPGFSEEELKRLEAEKLRSVEQQNPAAATGSGSGSGSAGSSTPASKPANDALIAPVPADQPAPDMAVAPCPPPPAPVKGFNVALFPLLDGQRADWPVWNATLRSDGRIESLSGSWVTFERAGNYKLRGVSAALKELQSPPVPRPAMEGGVVTDPAGPTTPMGGPAVDVPAGAVDGGPAVDLPAYTTTSAGATSAGSGSSGSAPTRLPQDGATVTTAVAMPAIEPAPPICAIPMPMPAEKATSSYAPGCVSSEPQVVTITKVELGLIQAPVFENGKTRLHLVPAYRFTGHFDNGTAWETSVVALHPDAIAPPPDFPVSNDLRGTNGVPAIGKAVPPVSADAPAEPAKESSSR